MKRTDISKKLIIEALIRGDNDVTALNGMKFLTTRVANHIVELRKEGLEISTETVKTKNSWYGVYKLECNEKNILRAYQLLETLQDHEAA
jgi:hypothetical protein